MGLSPIQTAGHPRPHLKEVNVAKRYISVTMQDAYGRETHKRIEVKEQVDLAAYSALFNDVLTDLQAITDLALVRADLTISNYIPMAGVPAAGANIDVGGTFQGELAGEENRKASHKVPGISAAYVGTAGIIDPTQADVVDYLAHFLEAGQCLLSDGESMGSWILGSLDK